MDIHTNIVTSHGAEMMHDLITRNFSATHAHSCLHHGIENILNAVDCYGLTRLLSLWDAQQIPALLPYIELQKIADCLDGNRTLATEGLNILLPKIIEFLRSDRGLHGTLHRPSLTSGSR